MQRLLQAQKLGNKAMVELLTINAQISKTINDARDSTEAKIMLAETRNVLIDLLESIGSVSEIICDSMEDISELLGGCIND